MNKYLGKVTSNLANIVQSGLNTKEDTLEELSESDLKDMWKGESNESVYIIYLEVDPGYNPINVKFFGVTLSLHKENFNNTEFFISNPINRSDFKEQFDTVDKNGRMNTAENEILNVDGSNLMYSEELILYTNNADFGISDSTKLYLMTGGE